MTFTLERESGPLTVVASGLDYAAFEDEFDKAAITSISEGRYKTFMYLCWHAMKRQDLTEQTFDEFLAESPTFGAPEKVEDVPPLESPQHTGM
ncbi:MAG: hypothetical protein K9G24_08395 [Candidatus Nanopelagicales bacterium]|nr:hypothetical protein [Candidatus Nanopelagicales bacterium]